MTKKNLNTDLNYISSYLLADIDDETLRSELVLRGYNVTRQRENETTAEIVKIG